MPLHPILTSPNVCHAACPPALRRAHSHPRVPAAHSARIGGSRLVSTNCGTYAHKRPALTTETLTARLGKGRWTGCNCGDFHRPTGERAVQPFDTRDLDSPIQHGGMVHLFLGKRREAFTEMNILGSFTVDLFLVGFNDFFTSKCRLVFFIFEPTHFTVKIFTMTSNQASPAVPDVEVHFVVRGVQKYWACDLNCDA